MTVGICAAVRRGYSGWLLAGSELMNDQVNLSLAAPNASKLHTCWPILRCIVLTTANCMADARVKRCVGAIPEGLCTEGSYFAIRTLVGEFLRTNFPELKSLAEV